MWRHRDQGGSAEAPRRSRIPWRQALGALGLAALVAALCACGSTTSVFEEPTPTGVTGTINGFVTDQATSSAVVGASISTIPGSGVIGKTDLAGFYQLADVVAGTYQIVATRGPGQNASVLTQLAANDTVRADIAFNAAASDVQRDLLFLVDDVTGNTRLAQTSTRGTVQSPGGLTILPISGLTARAKSLRQSRVSTTEAVLLSNSGSTITSIFDVYLIEIAGTQATPTRVTNTTVLKDSVDLSPNGEQLVVSQDTDGNGNFEIWLMDRSGQNATELVSDRDASTGETFDNRAVTWSSDGSSICFLSRRTDIAATFDQKVFEVTTVPVGGGRITLVTDDLDDKSDLSWNSLGLTILYAGNDGGHSQIFTVAASPNAKANRLTHTIFDQTFPVFSRDQRQLVWVSTDDFDGTNSDHSQEITAATPDGGGPFMSLTNLHAITQTTLTANVTYTCVNFRQP